MLGFQTSPLRMVAVLISLVGFPGCANDKSPSAGVQQIAAPTAPAFKSPVFDDLGRFHRIVFLCDGSTMMDKTPALKDQLGQAVDSLSADQSFNIIFMDDKTVNQVSAELLPATPGNKHKAAKFLEGIPILGMTEPITGLQTAFREKPDVIYLLADGDFPDNDSVAKTIRALNKGGNVRIYTIAFVNSVEQEFVDFFKQIARDGDGTFKQIDAKKFTPVFKSAMFDDLDQFHRIVIASDASGSMINKMASLKDQIEKAITNLPEETLFNILLFQDSKVDSAGEKLIPATAQNKRKAAVFLEGITSTCTTDPLPSIDEAFRERPDVIYLVTDGDFPDNDAVLRKFRELNKDKKVKVYTIAFVGQSDTDTAFIPLLKAIASESGGKYKLVRENNL